MKTSKHLMAVLGLGLLLAACGDDDDGDGDGDSGRAPTQAELEGKWYLRRAQTQGEADITSKLLVDTTVEIDEDSVFTGTEYYAQFGADSTFEIFQPNPDISELRALFPGVQFPADTPSRQEGRFRLDGTTLLTISGDDTLAWTATLQGASLVLESDIDTVLRYPVLNLDTVVIDGSGTLKGTYQK